MMAGRVGGTTCQCLVERESAGKKQIQKPSSSPAAHLGEEEEEQCRSKQHHFRLLLFFF
jgi:hypothetical protein